MLSLVDSEFALEFFKGIDPLNRFRCFCVTSNKGQDRDLQRLQRLKMIRLQQLALQDAEPDLDLVQLRGIGWQPKNLNTQRPSVECTLFVEPALQLHWVHESSRCPR